jgi:glycosyltransferase involved in cell wall biosynthesis
VFKLSVVIPARNEAATIGAVVSSMIGSEFVSEVIVVNNGSQDQTGWVAADAGARVVNCSRPGLGRAMKAGVEAAAGDLILRTDADIRNWNPAWIDLLRPRALHCLRRGIYGSPYSRFPISNYVVGPFLALYRPDWPSIPIPTTGTYSFDRSDYEWSTLPDNWAIDVAMLVSAMSNERVTVDNVEIGVLEDRERPTSHYIPMATDLIEFLVSYFVSDRPPLESGHST